MVGNIQNGSQDFVMKALNHWILYQEVLSSIHCTKCKSVSLFGYVDLPYDTCVCVFCFSFLVILLPAPYYGPDKTVGHYYGIYCQFLSGYMIVNTIQELTEYYGKVLMAGLNIHS